MLSRLRTWAQVKVVNLCVLAHAGEAGGSAPAEPMLLSIDDVRAAAAAASAVSSGGVAAAMPGSMGHVMHTQARTPARAQPRAAAAPCCGSAGRLAHELVQPQSTSMLTRMRAHLSGGVLGSERRVMHMQARAPGKHTGIPRQPACGSVRR